jgi:sugar phosphate isomerase/epimerase
MKFAVSNIAWAPNQRDIAYGLLADCGIAGLEIAPGLLLAGAGDVFNPTPAELNAACAPVAAAGLVLVSMQSLLFGVDGAALFGDADAQVRFRRGMERAICLAGRLGIGNLVFGSPRQRVIPDTMDASLALDHALTVFSDLGDLARAEGTSIAMEFNPAAYGANFLNNIDQAAAFVDRIAHPAIRLCFDVGAMHMNGDFGVITEAMPTHAPSIGHVHISEPDLAPAPQNGAQAQTVLTALREADYDRWISIEMKMVPEDPSLTTLHDCIQRLLTATPEAP